MKRAAATIAFVALVFAQSARDAYRTAYREWRLADPTLEHDAGSRSDLSARAALLAEDESKYASVYGTFLGTMAADETQKMAWLEAPPDAPSAIISEAAATLIANENRAAKRSMDAFAGDADPGIRQLRSMLARESAAADALSAAMETRKQASEALTQASSAVAESQLKVADRFHGIAAEGKQEVERENREAAAWSQYYSLLANGPAGTPSSATAAAPATQAAPAAPRPSITPVPLIRYTGAWKYPVSDGQYHGLQPESIDLVVNERNGQADGTFVGRFKLPPGDTDDPLLRFDISGEFKNARTQEFSLITSDGTRGIIQLIPGPAFNLLEVNFLTDPKPGKIRQGNMLLVKK